MKLPTMTTGKQWLALLAIALIEAFLAFIFFAYTPVPFIGLILVILVNVQWIFAAYLGIKNANK